MPGRGKTRPSASLVDIVSDSCNFRNRLFVPAPRCGGSDRNWKRLPTMLVGYLGLCKLSPA